MLGRRTLFAVTFIGVLLLGGFAYLIGDAGVFVFLGPCVVFFFLMGLRSVLKDEKVARGDTLMSEGRFSQASALLEGEARGFQLNARAMCSLGVCRLNLWQLERAVEALDKARLQQPLSNPREPELGERAQLHLALALVLVGNWTAGRDWALQLAPQQRWPGLGPLIFAAVAARDRNWKAVRTQLSNCQRNELSPPLRALAQVLDAWSAEQLNEPRQTIDRVALYAEGGPEQLQKKWPELAEFVERAA
ncbi:MAG: hypothetical protein QM817_36550 [Archangium sp.]